MKWPTRYFAGLSEAAKKMRVKELIRRRTSKHPKLAASDKLVKTRKSSWTQMFHREYPNRKVKIQGTLKTVYNRGLKAWQTGGSRPGTTAQQWGLARVYKFILISKGKATTKKFDPDASLRPWRGSF